MIRGLLFLLFVWLIPSAAFAGLFVCNETTQKITVGYGMQGSSSEPNISGGWWRLSPKQCKRVLKGRLLQGTNYYYYAVSFDGRLKWHGENREDKRYFCVYDDNFASNNRDRDCEQLAFRRIPVKSERYILRITERNNPKVVAQHCYDEYEDEDAFVRCFTRNMASRSGQDMLKCAMEYRSKADIALCAFRGKFHPAALKVANCVARYNKSLSDNELIECLGEASSRSTEQIETLKCLVSAKDTSPARCLVDANLNAEQRRWLKCVEDNRGSGTSTAFCLVQDRLPKKAPLVFDCALKNSSSYTSMAVCAAGDQLTPEQRVFAECAVSTGGTPYPMAACVGGQLTVNELQKCFTDGVGGDGCFGRNNDARKFVENAWKDVTEGPGPSHDLLGEDGFIPRKFSDLAKDIAEGPGPTHDIVGEDGWVCENFLGGC